MSIVGRAVESLFYNSAVAGTHRAMVAMGFIPADQPGSPLDQIRATQALPPAAEAKPAATETTPPEEQAPEAAAGRKRGRA